MRTVAEHSVHRYRIFQRATTMTTTITSSTTTAPNIQTVGGQSAGSAAAASLHIEFEMTNAKTKTQALWVCRCRTFGAM